MTVETNLQYELTPIPLSLFNNRDQKINKANKKTSKTSMDALTNPLELNNKTYCILVNDCGWPLYIVKWNIRHARRSPTFTWVTCSVWGAAPRRQLWSLMVTADR